MLKSGIPDVIPEKMFYWLKTFKMGDKEWAIEGGGGS